MRCLPDRWEHTICLHPLAAVVLYVPSADLLSSRLDGQEHHRSGTTSDVQPQADRDRASLRQGVRQQAARWQPQNISCCSTEAKHAAASQQFAAWTSCTASSRSDARAEQVPQQNTTSCMSHELQDGTSVRFMDGGDVLAALICRPSYPIRRKSSYLACCGRCRQHDDAGRGHTIAGAGDAGPSPACP